MPIVQSLDPADVEPLPEPKQGHGSLQTKEGNLPLKLMDVKARVVGLLSTTEVRQTFANTTGEHLEATYIFPLPDRAGVTRFRLEVGERVVEGELRERGQARQAYDAALQAGHRAAIAEEERSDVFTLRVGNLPPGEEVSVWLDLAGPLELSAGSATYRFPLVVAPRYTPGIALPGAPVGSGVALDTDQVPDASRISPPTLLPGQKSPVQLSLELTVDPAGLKITNFRSTMEVEHGFEIPGTLRLRPGERLNQDFVFRFDTDHDLQASLVIERDEPGASTGTLMFMACGPDQREAFDPKDVVFVIDRSGSMSGWKMVAARRACADLIDQLGPQDTFEVVAFDHMLEHPFAGSGPRKATPHNRYVAAGWLNKLEARGGTKIAEAMSYALQTVQHHEERDQSIVLITDGQVSNDRGVLQMLEQRGLKGRRIYTLGIDRSVSAGFLRSLATAGGGRCETVESPERLKEVLDHFSKEIGGPFLEDLSFFAEGGGVKVDPESVAPVRGHHLYPNVPLLVMARFSGLKDPSRVRASLAGVLPQIPVEVTEGNVLRPAWARKQLRELEDRWAAVSYQGGRSALESKIVEVSLKHRVLCRFTAFVAVDRAEVVNQGGGQTRITQPVERPAGWGVERLASLQAPGGSMGAIYGASSQELKFGGFAPGFAPSARRTRATHSTHTHATHSTHGPGGQSRFMRCVPVPRIASPSEENRKRALDLAKKILAADPDQDRNMIWNLMDRLNMLLLNFSTSNQVLLKELGQTVVALLNRSWTEGVRRSVETIRDELQRIAPPGEPRRQTFWK